MKFTERSVRLRADLTGPAKAGRHVLAGPLVLVGLHVLLVAIVLNGAALSAQGRQAQVRKAQAAAGQDLPGISPAEVQQMFDSAALIQAQQRLNIRDEQFPQFLRRFKTLQDIRRMGLNERMRRVNQLQRLLMPSVAFDESAVNEQLKALKDLDARLAADVAKAYESIDEVLDARQRAQFRVFEETMERQKIELVTRARQANRPKP
jgi:Spy/CpxP family protein refolding chaperone